MEIDQSFIAAILTVIGYSVNDKVVVFDRVREVIGLYPKRDRYLVINEALNSTLARTISTSLSTAIVLLCIFILGGDTIRSFTFAMLLGVIVGTFRLRLCCSSGIRDYGKKTEKSSTCRGCEIRILSLDKNRQGF